MSIAVVKDGYRWVILKGRRRVHGLPAYEGREDAEVALCRYDPEGIYRYFIQRELAR